MQENLSFKLESLNCLELVKYDITCSDSSTLKEEKNPHWSFCETCCLEHISRIHLHPLLLAVYIYILSVYMHGYPKCCSPFWLGRYKMRYMWMQSFKCFVDIQVIHIGIYIYDVCYLWYTMPFVCNVSNPSCLMITIFADAISTLWQKLWHKMTYIIYSFIAVLQTSW